MFQSQEWESGRTPAGRAGATAAGFRATVADLHVSNRSPHDDHEQGEAGVAHLLAAAACLARYGSPHGMVESPDLAHYPFNAPPGWGYPLPVACPVWAGVVVAMYPLCRWFAAPMQRRRDAWLSCL
jgi:hypothetical protein